MSKRHSVLFILFTLLVTLSVVFILYLSWVPNPRLGLLWFIPNWLAKWVDVSANDTIRTGVPLFVLGLVIGVWLSGASYSWHWWLGSWLILVMVVIIAEFGQLFLPHRSFDWWDITWGAIGASTGLIIGASFAFIGKQLKAVGTATQSSD